MKTLIKVVLVLFAISVFTGFVIQKLTLKQNCTGYLKRAGDANTVETAYEELTKAITYLEKNKMTSGYTSVFWKTPDEDVSFWYKNLKDSQAELAQAKLSKSMMEKSNVLMKLRETLMDSNDKGDVLTVPTGLSRFPHNTLWGTLFFLACISLFVSLLEFKKLEWK